MQNNTRENAVICAVWGRESQQQMILPLRIQKYTMGEGGGGLTPLAGMQ